MAGSPDYKIYRDGEYVGCVKYAEDAAVLVAVSGGEVRWGHSKSWRLWAEGSEEFPAGESYDSAAEIMNTRLRNLQQQSYDRVTAAQDQFNKNVQKQNELNA